MNERNERIKLEISEDRLV